MKNKVFILFVVVTFCLSISSCSCEKKHKHEYSSEYTYNEEYHYQECNGCSELQNKEAHTYNEWTIVTNPTIDTTGLKKHSCTICGYEATEVIEKLEHTHNWNTTYTYDEEYHYQECSGCSELKNKNEHTFNNNKCVNCNYAILYTEGLEYELNNDNESYSVIGIGTANNSDIVIPRSYNNLPITIIGDLAFGACNNITSVEISSSVTSIGSNAFGACNNLASIEIPPSVINIGSYAFADCNSLKSIKIPSSVTSIEKNAFIYCSNLTSITVDSNNPVYDSRENCNAIIETSTDTLICGCSETIIPSSITSIGDYAFIRCTNLTSITLSSNITSIGDNTFHKCTSLISITVDSNNPVYDSRDNCNAIIETATNKLIKGCKNTIIPSSVTSIGKYAFNNCINLTSVTIPNSITIIENFAFTGCINLLNIIVDSNNTIYDSRDNCNAIIETATNKLIVGCNNTIIPPSVTNIGSFSFSGYGNLTDIIIPMSVKRIGNSVFSGCNSLTIYCEAPSIPVGWDSRWNPDNRPVVWDYKS